MVSAILLHYVIDNSLPTRGTFGDPGSNPGADNFFYERVKKKGGTWILSYDCSCYNFELKFL